MSQEEFVANMRGGAEPVTRRVTSDADGNDALRTMERVLDEAVALHQHVRGGDRSRRWRRRPS